MKFERELLNQDLHYILDISHNGYCCNEGNEEYPCDHEYNRCYRISGIEVSEPTKGALNYLAEALVPECKGDALVKDKILAILDKMHSQFNLTDVENYQWDATGDYYGDHLNYVYFSGTLQEWLADELELA